MSRGHRRKSGGSQLHVTSNRCDLSSHRKLVIKLDDLTIGGRLFHILGAAAVKARDAVTVLILDMTRRSVPANAVTESECSHDNRGKIVCWLGCPTLCGEDCNFKNNSALIGSQCSDRRSCAADELYGASQTMRAKKFCTRCKRLLL